jgi:hypothetical protein
VATAGVGVACVGAAGVTASAAGAAWGFGCGVGTADEVAAGAGVIADFTGGTDTGTVGVAPISQTVTIEPSPNANRLAVTISSAGRIQTRRYRVGHERARGAPNGRAAPLPHARCQGHGRCMRNAVCARSGWKWECCSMG